MMGEPPRLESGPLSPVDPRLDRAFLVALAVSFALQLIGFLVVRLNAGCRGDGCLGLGVPAVLAMAVNFLLGTAGFVVLVWLLVSGRPVQARHLGLLALIWLNLIGFVVLQTHRP